MPLVISLPCLDLQTTNCPKISLQNKTLLGVYILIIISSFPSQSSLSHTTHCREKRVCHHLPSSMEMAIANAATPLSSYLKISKPHTFSSSFSTPPNFSKNKNAVFCGLMKTHQSMEPMSVKGRFGSSRGGPELLERPTFDQSQFDPLTQSEAGGDIGQVGDKKATRSGDSYKVLLIDDERHTEELVAKVLPRVVPSVSPDVARILFHKSREAGFVVVIVTVKEHAEFYAQMMIRGGLRSAIEPDSGTALLE